MTWRNKWNRLLTAAFCLLLFAGFLKNGSLNEIIKLGDYLTQKDLNSSGTVTLQSLEQDFSSSLWKRQDLIDLNGRMARYLNMQGFYSDLKMYVADGGYIVTVSDRTSGDYEVGETAGLYSFLQDHGIKFLYVNKPTKYLDDSLHSRMFGIESWSNRNMDSFLARLRERGVPSVDLRDAIREEGLDIKDLFYRTDHHWTTGAALWACGKIAAAVNEYCGYELDPSLYGEDHFVMKQWKDCWLGEQGRKVGRSYVGLDDFTLIRPDFETSYTFYTGKKKKEGTFDDFIDETVLNTETDVYDNDSWHYSYKRINCVNHNVGTGKVLIIGDSYDQTTVPFLSLSFHETDSLIMRDTAPDFDLKKYILDKGYDTVLVMYAQFMLGQHDNPGSANYRMYSFDGA